MAKDARNDNEDDGIPVVAGPQAISAVTPQIAPSTAPAILSTDERTLLVLVLNRIIPPEDVLPGAGEGGVGATIERTLAVSLSLRRLFLDGLHRIALYGARQQPDGGFAALTPEAQEAVLRAVEEDAPAFFAALVDHTYRNYYADPQIHRLIGWNSRPPQPLGHTLAPFDPALLAAQQDRIPFWRRIT